MKPPPLTISQGAGFSSAGIAARAMSFRVGDLHKQAAASPPFQN